MRTLTLMAASLLLVSFGLRAADAPGEAVSPKEVIKLFNGTDLRGFTTWLKESKREDPKKVFSVADGTIHIAGMPMGYLATDREYRDYHLKLEYKWGKETFGAKGVRNSGVLLHAVGPDGGAGGVWMSCFECQLAQGCEADIIMIRGKDAKGEPTSMTMSAETEVGPDKHLRWKMGGEKKTWPPTKGQLWWSKHEPGFKEAIDTRGKDDVASPLGEWTRVECICAGKRITLKVNGTVVNEIYDVTPAAGKILLQSEGFEIFFRNVELHPLTK
jgi:hypothetical protein